MGWEEAKTFRLSSFAAALRLNDLQRFKLERSQPHNLVTCQRRHVEIVVAIEGKQSDRTTQIEILFPKEREKEPPYKISLAVSHGTATIFVLATFTISVV